MSSIGHPDDQDFAQWLGHPFVANAALALGAGTHTDGPYTVSNFASVILAIAPTTHGVTATITQQIQGAPAGLTVVENFTIGAGATLFEAIVLTGNIVTLQLQGGGAGTTVAYALYPSNTTTNTSVTSSTVLNFLHNGLVVKAEPGLDMEDAAAVGNPAASPIVWTPTDNAGVSVSYTPTFALGVQHNDASQVNEAVLDFEDAHGVTWALTDDAANNRVKVTPTYAALLNHTAFTADVNFSTGTEGTATTIVTSGAFTPDGTTPVIIEFFCAALEDSNATASTVTILLVRDSTIVAGKWTTPNFSGVAGDNQRLPIFLSFRETPSNASHTYTVKAWLSNNAQPFVFRAGTGGSATFPPGFIRAAYDR